VLKQAILVVLLVKRFVYFDLFAWVFRGRIYSFLIETQAQNSTGEQHYSGFLFMFSWQDRRIGKARDFGFSVFRDLLAIFEAAAKRGLLAFGFSSSSEVFSLFVDF